MKQVPAEVMEQGILVNKALKRRNRASDQVKAWQHEENLAEKEFAVATQRHAQLVSRWNPATNAVEPLLEAPKP